MKRSKVLLVVALALVVLSACSSSDGADEGAGGSGELGWTRLSPAELQQMMDQEDVYLVNVHVPYEGDIVGTDASISYLDLASRADELPTGGDPKLVIYCRSGNMSTQAAQDLVDAGVTGFYELEGGFTAWNDAGLPFQTG